MIVSLRVGWSRVSGLGVGRVHAAGGRSGDQQGEDEGLWGGFFVHIPFVIQKKLREGGCESPYLHVCCVLVRDELMLNEALAVPYIRREPSSAEVNV